MDNHKSLSKSLLIIAIVLLVFAAVLASAYAGFGFWVRGNGRLLPGVSVVDAAGATIADLGGMSEAEADAALASALQQQLESASITVLYGDGLSAELSGHIFAVSGEGILQQGLADKTSRPFWELPVLWLGVVKSPVKIAVSPLALSAEGAQEVAALKETIAAEVNVTAQEFTWEVSEKELRIQKGVTGKQADLDRLEQRIEEAAVEGAAQVTVDTLEFPAVCPSAEELRQMIYVEPAYPRPDGEGGLLPYQVGIDLDPSKAQPLLDSTEPGAACLIPLIRTDPDPATKYDCFFQDVLAEWNSYIDGTEDRVFNVTKAANACNGQIIEAGEEFSFLGVVGCPDVPQGYRKALGYLSGRPVLMGGGGVCQVSSALYTCAVYADLEIVARANHSYSQDYVPLGLDAAIAYPNLNFVFRNNTPYPIYVETIAEGRDLEVRLLGTEYRDITVETEINVLSTNPWTTTYKEDSSVPLGTTVTTVDPHEGSEVDVYRIVRAADGTILSRTLENHSSYGTLDKVVSYNPQDSWPWVPASPEPTPSRRPSSPSHTRRPSSTPAPTATPEPTPEPAPTPAPTPAPEPTEPAPAASDPAAPPPVPSETERPVSSAGPVSTPEPPPVQTAPSAPDPQESWVISVDPSQDPECEIPSDPPAASTPAPAPAQTAQPDPGTVASVAPPETSPEILPPLETPELFDGTEEVGNGGQNQPQD